jgi:hypothetical protein
VMQPILLFIVLQIICLVIIFDVRVILKRLSYLLEELVLDFGGRLNLWVNKSGILLFRGSKVIQVRLNILKQLVFV